MRAILSLTIKLDHLQNHYTMKTSTLFRLPTASLLAVSIILTSCAVSPDGKLTQAQGAGIGAGAGGVLGAIIGHQSGNSAQGALIGAGVGGLSGFIYGTHVANQKAKYKSAEEWLDACIADANRKHQDAVVYNQKLDQRIDALKKEIRLAKAQNERAKLNALKSKIAAEEAKAVKQANDLEKEVDLHSRVADEAPASSKTSTLRKKADALESVRRVTGQRRQILAQLKNSTGV